MDLSAKEYIVDHIMGDYAMLRRIDQQSEGLNQVALALLPDGISVGSKLHWEMFSYTLAD